ncbi:MAG: substrate-binding domain-containing protein [Clostridia bacterium]|nr:substrate-binding domain-containing protein [Clostridia bacterium]
MKKRRRTGSITALSLAIALMIFGVTELTLLGSGESSATDGLSSPRLTFVNGDSISPNTVSEYWQKCVEGVQAAAADNGASISLMSLEHGSPYSSMADLYDSAMLAQVDGIMCVGFDPQVLVDKIDAAFQKGIPTVCIDGDIPSSMRIAYIGSDNYAMGERAAEILLQRLDRSGEIHVVYPSYATPQFIERAQGFICRIQAETDNRLVVEQPSSQIGDYQNYTRAILESRDVAAIFCPGTTASVRIARIASQLYPDNSVHIACIDDYSAILHAIDSGIIDFTIVQNPFEMGRQAVKLLCDYLNSGGEPPADAVVYTDTYIIDKANVREYLADEVQS